MGNGLIGRRTFTSSLLACLAWGLPVASAAQDSPVPESAVWRAAGIARLARPIDPPPLVLPDLSGQAVDLRQLRGQVVLLYFWATW